MLVRSLTLFYLLLFGQELQAFTSQSPITVTPTPDKTTEVLTCQLNSKTEEDGKFSGPWNPDTLTCFNRTLGVFKICYSGLRQFLRYADEDPSLKMRSLSHGQPLDWNIKTHCWTYLQYVRDCRSNTTKPIDGRATYIMPFSSSSVCEDDCANGNGEANATYPLNLDAIWHVAVPKGYGVVVIIIRLEIEQAESGACKHDYITVYGDTDSKNPTKMCGNVNSQRFTFTDGTTSKVTIKFQSNHENNRGLFKGGIYVFHLDSLNASGSSGTDNVIVRSRRRKSMEYEGSGAVNSDVGNAGNDIDDDGTNEENSEIFREETFEDYVPIVNGELEDEVIDCFSAIISHGHRGAQMYLNGLVHPICRTFAEKFERNGYVTPIA